MSNSLDGFIEQALVREEQEGPVMLMESARRVVEKTRSSDFEPPDIDFVKLGAELAKLPAEHAFLIQEGKGPRSRTMRDLESIQRHRSNFDRALHPRHSQARLFLYREFLRAGGFKLSFADYQADLRRVASVISSAIRVVEAWDPKKLQPLTPIDFIVGVRLAEIFERYFRRRPGLGREVKEGSKPKSPFILFAQATLDEFGIRHRKKGEPHSEPYSLETIYRALRVSRSWRSSTASRRKSSHVASQPETSHASLASAATPMNREGHNNVGNASGGVDQ